MAQSVFSRMCDELSATVVPLLQGVGFTPPREPFSRHTVKYPFTRVTPSGTQVLEILFNKYRRAVFSVQVYVAPQSGMAALVERGGTLTIGSVSATPHKWPFPARPFRAEPGRLQRLLGGRGPGIKQAVESFVSLLPEIEDWWTHQRSTRHITVGTLTYPGARAGP